MADTYKYDHYKTVPDPVECIEAVKFNKDPDYEDVPPDDLPY